MATLVPKAEPVHGYTLIKGVVAWATAILAPLGLKATPSASPVGSVAGLAYFVPNPVPLHG